MEKIITVLTFLVSLSLFSTVTFAATGEGTIDEIKVCGTGSGYAQPGWKNLLFFKLSDDQWFVTPLNHALNDADNDNNATYSIIMTAYSSRYKVKVNANYNVSSSWYQPCGITAVGGLRHLVGDYIALKEYVQ